jgi:hypothetical protein
MAYNIAKCGTFKGTAFFLGDKQIPVVEEYRYLGFPHSSRGIMWQKHLDDCVIKASKLLTFIEGKAYSGQWPEWIKLAIFKSFVRPVYEYGAPALYHLFNTQSISLRTAEDFQNRAIKWITELGRKRIHIARALTDLPTVSDRFYILAISFMDHIEQSALSNPIWKIRRAFSNPPWSPNSILPRVLSEQILFRHLPQLNREPEEPLRQFTWRRIREFVDQKYSSYGLLPSFILRSARRRNSERNKTFGFDRCLFIKDSETRRNAILWRANIFGMRNRCPSCKQQFTRAHVDRCNLLDGVRLGNTLQILEQELEDHPRLAAASYGIIDCLLNNKKYFFLQLAFIKLELLWEEDSNSNSTSRRIALSLNQTHPSYLS